MDTLAERLKAARKHCGLSQEKTANEIGVSLNTYRNWEYGNHQPPMDMVVELSKLFVISLRWLATGEIEPTPEELKKRNKGRKGINLPHSSIFVFNRPFYEEMEFDENGNPILQPEPDRYMEIDTGWSVFEGEYVILEKTKNNMVVGVFNNDKVCIREVKQDPRAKTFKPAQFTLYAISVYSNERKEWQVFYRYITYIGSKLFVAGLNPFIEAPQRLDNLGDKFKVFGEVLGWVHTHTPWAPVW